TDAGVMENDPGPVMTVLLAALALVGCLAGPVHAFHSTFSASLDRVEIDGNVFGPYDGVPDVVDEFDDGAVGPGWSQIAGSSTESGGVVTFHNPGVDFAYTPTI